MPIAGAPAAAGRTGARVGPRFVAAVAVSALVHAALIGVAQDPGARSARVHPGAHNPPLVARLIAAAPLLPAASPEAPRVALKRLRASPVARKPSAQATPGGVAIASEREGEDRAGAPDATYYAARQLDRYPELITALELKFPSDIDLAVSAGHVLLLVLIDAQGRVNDASVVEAAPPGVFDEDATRALWSARFTPAVKDGRAVRSRLVVHVTYGKPE